MTPVSTSEPRRQDDQQELVDRAFAVPSVTEAMAAYARISTHIAPLAPPPVVKYQVASGGNA
jgi:hypothetical protein